MLITAIATLTLTQGAPAAAAAPKLPVEIKFVKAVPGLRPLAFAPGPVGASVAMTLESREVRVFNAKTRETGKVLVGHPQSPYAIDWSADGALIATGDESARVFIWDAKTGQRVREIRGHQRGIQALSFNSARTLLASTGKDDVVKVWDVSTGKQVQSIPGQGINLYSASFLPLSSALVAGTLGGGARLYDAKSGALGASMSAPNLEEINDVAFNSAGTRLVTAGRQGTSRLWDLKTKKGLGNFSGHGDWVVRAAFSPNGKFVATSSTDGTVRVYNVFDFKPVAVIEQQSPVGSPVVWTADGNWLLTAGFDDSLQIHSVTPAQAATPPAPVKKAPAKKRRR